MVTRRATSWAALTVALALSVSACGSNDHQATDPAAGGSTTAPDTSASHKGGVDPASGPMLKAQGFSFHAPKGWADVTDHAASGVLLSAAHPADEQPLAITVRREARGAGTADAARAQAKAALRKASATHVRVLPDTVVGGNPAAHAIGIQHLRGTHYRLDVYYVRTPKAGWALTFATDQYTTKDRRNAMLRSVLETCHWQSA
jgi:hypothetical protein